ncbi:MAG: hypothetical protein IKJ01_00435 [Lachnospiraceae bacterium]|nr:hypothetical protein [Lachnospiraceae bacterium]
MKKDSEKFLEILLRKRTGTEDDSLSCNINEFSEIPNIKFNINSILEDLKANGCITHASSQFLGIVVIYLTIGGIKYFEDKEKILRGEDMGSNINNFYGNVSNMQIQQGNINSTQTQTVASMETVDFDKVMDFISKIKKYDTFFDDELGDKATSVREKLVEIETLAQKRENPSKIKMLLIELKNLVMGISGSIIASGIVEGLSLFQ